MKLAVKLLEEWSTLPTRGTKESAGLDLKTFSGGILLPGQTWKLRTGIAVSIPSGHVGKVVARSSAKSKGLDIDGTIDSDYRGEIWVVVTNVSNGPVTLEANKSYAQLIIHPVLMVEAEELEELTETQRGSNGFGSTGQ